MVSRIITSFAGQFFIVLFGLALVSACSMRAETVAPYINTLADTHWELKKLPGYETPIERPPTLSFTSDRLSGFNGCNRIFASYTTAQDGSVAFGPLGATRMACLNQAGDIEKAVNQALTNTSLFALSRDALNLMDNKRNVIMTLVPKAAE